MSDAIFKPRHRFNVVKVSRKEDNGLWGRGYALKDESGGFWQNGKWLTSLEMYFSDYPHAARLTAEEAWNDVPATDDVDIVPPDKPVCMILVEYKSPPIGTHDYRPHRFTVDADDIDHILTQIKANGWVHFNEFHRIPAGFDMNEMSSYRIFNV